MTKIVITGGAGTGKTTIINELKRMGCCVVDESARIIIASEQTHKQMNPAYNEIVPWTDNYAFQERIVDLQEMMENNVKTVPVVYLDRSLVDGIAYCKFWDNEELPYLRKKIDNANYNYVFYLEPLDNYENDDQRKESEEENKQIQQLLYDTYKDMRFDIVRVPKMSIDERMGFILNKVIELGAEKEKKS